MYTLSTFLVGHELRLSETQILASGSVAFDTVHFDFDDNWAGLSKVALFWGADGNVYGSMVDAEGNAAVPWEALADAGRIKFGVYGVTGSGDDAVRATSTLIHYKLPEGAWTEDGQQPTPAEQTIIEQAIAAAQQAVSDAQAAAADAAGSATDAAGSATNASSSASAASTSKEQAAASATAANTAKTAAETAQGKAETAQTAAETAQGKAETAQGKAETAQAAAEAAAAQAAGKVSYVEAQTLTAAQQTTARDNIGAGSASDVGDLKSAVQLDEKYALLLHDEIPGTTQTITFDSLGNVSTITHTNGNNVATRTDAFTFATNSITEVRTLNTGESLTIATNTTTLTTTVTYAA